jgi:hypothetical protein
MTAGLVRKELRELRPILVVAAFLLFLDCLEWLIQRSSSSRGAVATELSDFGPSLAAMLFVLAFAVGTGLLVREIDDRTLAFLDGLPIGRGRVFGTKVATAAGVLLLYPVGHVLMLMGQHLLERQSLDHALHPALLLQYLALTGVVIGVGLAAGILFGFLRNLGWLALALCAMTIGVLVKLAPSWSVLNPAELLQLRLVGTRWPVPMRSLVIHLGLIAGFTGLAALVFNAAGGGHGRRLQLWLARPMVSAALALTTIAVAIGAVALLAQPQDESARTEARGKQSSTAKFETSASGSARTARYSFNYPASQPQQLQLVLGEADRVHDEVAALLGVEPGASIDVDLSGSIQNTEGTAFHDRIRMHLGQRPLETLAHETAHVLALRLAGGEFARELPKMNVLNEGLASWIANRISIHTGLTDTQRFEAAIVSQRHLVKAEQLTDIQALAKQVDLSLKYPLGAALIESMVARYGPDAPRKVLVAIGDPDFPRGLQGTELWFAAFQAAGMDLPLVFDDYTRRLKSWEEEFSARIAALPRPRVSLFHKKGFVGLELRMSSSLPEGWVGVLRWRPTEDSPLEQYTTISITGGSVVAWISESAAVGGRVCFQPGVGSRDVGILEAWVCLPVDTAAEWKEPEASGDQPSR